MEEHAGTCSAFAIQVALQTFLRTDEMDIVVASNNWAKTSPNGLITIVFRKGLDENLQQHQAFRKTGGMAMPKLYECSLLHFSNICKSIYYHILYHTISMHDVLWNWNLHAEIPTRHLTEPKATCYPRIHLTGRFFLIGGWSQNHPKSSKIDHVWLGKPLILGSPILRNTRLLEMGVCPRTWPSQITGPFISWQDAKADLQVALHVGAVLWTLGLKLWSGWMNAAQRSVTQWCMLCSLILYTVWYWTRYPILGFWRYDRVYVYCRGEGT